MSTNVDDSSLSCFDVSLWMKWLTDEVIEIYSEPISTSIVRVLKYWVHAISYSFDKRIANWFLKFYSHLDDFKQPCCIDGFNVERPYSSELAGFPAVNHFFTSW